MIKNMKQKMYSETDDEKHPGVAKIYAQPDIYVTGPVKVLSESESPDRFDAYYARPAEIRAIFAQMGWEKIAGFQIRNPIHRSHKYVTKIALEVSDGVLIHPLVGKLKDNDIPANIRMKCYEVLLEKYCARTG